MNKFGSSLILLAYLLLASTGSAGEVKVYDTNDQFLGILLDSSVYYTTVYIPSLNVVTEITNHPSVGASDKGDVREHGDGSLMCCTDKVIFADSDYSGTPHFDAAYPVLIKYRCDGKYYKTNGKMNYIYSAYIRKLDCTAYDSGHYGGYLQELEETTLPFTVPLALPLKFRYSKGAVVVPLGN